MIMEMEMEMDSSSDQSLSCKKRKVLTSPQLGGISLIPSDLLFSILLRLPVKDILRSRSVSKEWNLLSRTPKFISLHYNRSLQIRHENNANSSSSFIYLRSLRKVLNNDYSYSNRNFLLTSLTLEKTTTTQLVAKVDKEEDFPTMLSSLLFPSCPTKLDMNDLQIICPFDGLICFRCGERVIMYNPATRESRVLPSDPQCCNFGSLYSCYQHILGVWFESTVKQQYKVFKMVYWRKSNNWSCQINIYDSTVNSWRVSETISGNSHTLLSGLLLNGVVHFCTKNKNNRLVIVTFDAKLETFGHLELPPCFRDGSYFELVLLPFRGNLACLKQKIAINDYHVKWDIWVMTKNGVEQSWTQKHFDDSVFPLYYGFYVHNYFWPLAFWRNGNDQDELLGKTSTGETLSYNLVTQKKTDLKLPCIYDFGGIIPYNLESLLSLNV